MSLLNKSYNRLGLFSGSTLKILACIFMACDHIGVVFFSFSDPIYLALRMIGRLAFPLFAYFIAEGCKYTKNKLKRFLTVFIIGAMYVLCYLIYDGEIYLNVFVTFSISILLIYLWQWAKKLLFNDKKPFLASLIFIALISAVCAVWYINENVYLEYGLKGALLPLFICLFDVRGINAPKILNKLDNHYVGLISMSLGLALMCIDANLGDIQKLSFVAVLLLIFYNGTVGIKKMKYVFYIFYPAHLVIIEGIAILISIL